MLAFLALLSLVTSTFGASIQDFDYLTRTTVKMRDNFAPISDLTAEASHLSISNTVDIPFPCTNLGLPCSIPDLVIESAILGGTVPSSTPGPLVTAYFNFKED